MIPKRNQMIALKHLSKQMHSRRFGDGEEEQIPGHAPDPNPELPEHSDHSSDSEDELGVGNEMTDGDHNEDDSEDMREDDLEDHPDGAEQTDSAMHQLSSSPGSLSKHEKAHFMKRGHTGNLVSGRKSMMVAGSLGSIARKKK